MLGFACSGDFFLALRKMYFPPGEIIPGPKGGSQGLTTGWNHPGMTGSGRIIGNRNSPLFNVLALVQTLQ